MQIKVFVKRQDIEELANFLKSPIPYEHNIEFNDQISFGRSHFNSSYLEVSMFYDDYVLLNEWKISKELLKL
jgi:hypothetical protein